MRLATTTRAIERLSVFETRVRRVAQAAAQRPALLAMLVIAVGILDLALTVRALDMGRLVELNPFMDWVIRGYGRLGVAAYRGIASLGGAILLKWALTRYACKGVRVEAARRVHAVVAVGVVIIVTTHVSLVLWWAAWLGA